MNGAGPFSRRPAAPVARRNTVADRIDNGLTRHADLPESEAFALMKSCCPGEPGKLFVTPSTGWRQLQRTWLWTSSLGDRQRRSTLKHLRI